MANFEVKPQDPKWAMTPSGKYHRLIHLYPTDGGLRGASAVFVIWHSGVRPQWVYVGSTTNLAASLESVLGNDDIMQYEANGGLFVTWFEIRKGLQRGVIHYLNSVLEPLVAGSERPGKRVTPVPVLIPGIKR